MTSEMAVDSCTVLPISIIPFISKVFIQSDAFLCRSSLSLMAFGGSMHSDLLRTKMATRTMC